MLQTLIHSHFALTMIASHVASGLVGAAGFAVVFAGKFLASHPNNYITMEMWNLLKQDLKIDILTTLNTAAPVTVNVTPAPAPVLAKEPAAPPVPQYNQD